jgi:hypothetical protein
MLIFTGQPKLPVWNANFSEIKLFFKNFWLGKKSFSIKIYFFCLNSVNFIPVPVLPPPPLIPPVLTYWMTGCAGGGHYLLTHKWLGWGWWDMEHCEGGGGGEFS